MFGDRPPRWGRELIRKVNNMDAGLEALVTKVGELETADNAVAENVAAAVTEIQGLDKEIEELKTKTGITDADIEPLTNRISAVAGKLNGAVEALKGVGA